MLNQLKRMSVTLFATLMLLTSAFAGIGSVDQIAVPVENTSESNIVFAFAEEMPRKKKASRKGKRSRRRQKSLTGGEDIEKPKGEKQKTQKLKTQKLKTQKLQTPKLKNFKLKNFKTQNL